jgi:hypothetical protein
MGQKLPPDQMELYRRVDEVLHYLWDPIGVSGNPEARGEYCGYLPHVFSLLVNGAAESEIVDFLVKTETETMGLSYTQRVADRAREITSILARYRDFTQKRNTEGHR